MRLYLAGPYSRRITLTAYAHDLTTFGWCVTSRWLTGAHESSTATPSDGERRAWARADLADIDAADVLVAFSPGFLGCDDDEGRSGGRHVEVGYALHRGIPVVLVGEPENVFASLLRRASSWTGALDVLFALADSLGDRARSRVRLGDGPGPEQPVRVELSVADVTRAVGDGLLVPPSPGGNAACLHTGVQLAGGHVALDLPFDVLAGWVDATRAVSDATAGGS